MDGRPAKAKIVIDSSHFSSPQYAVLEETSGLGLILKDTPDSSIHKETYDGLALNRQKVSHQIDTDVDQSEAERGIPGLQYRQGKQPASDVYCGSTQGKTVSVLGFNNVRPRLQSQTGGNSNPKSSDTDKHILDTIKGWNLAPGNNTISCNIIFNAEAGDEIEELTSRTSNVSLSLIGRGSFGSVFSSRGGEKSALLMKKTMKAVNPNEIMVPLKLKSCRNLMQVYALNVQDNKFCIVLQNCGLSLKALVRDHDFMSHMGDPMNYCRFLEGMFNAATILETSGACHGDLKLENVCAKYENNTYVPRLIDFGTCQTRSEKPSMDGISPEFLPPKVNMFALSVFCDFPNNIHCNEQGSLFFDEKTDSWSLCIIGLSILKRGNHPLREVQEYQKFDWKERHVVMQKIAHLTDEEVDSWIPSDLHPDIKKLFRENLWVAAYNRWYAKETLEYLRKITLQQDGPTIDVSQKRGKKRPVSPLLSEQNLVWKVRQLSTHGQDEDDTTNLKEFLKGPRKKTPNMVAVGQSPPVPFPSELPPACVRGEVAQPKICLKVSKLDYNPAVQREKPLTLWDKVKQQKVSHNFDGNPAVNTPDMFRLQMAKGPAPVEVQMPTAGDPNLGFQVIEGAAPFGNISMAKVAPTVGDLNLELQTPRAVAPEDDSMVAMNSPTGMPNFSLLLQEQPDPADVRSRASGRRRVGKSKK